MGAGWFSPLPFPSQAQHFSPTLNLRERGGGGGKGEVEEGGEKREVSEGVGGGDARSSSFPPLQRGESLERAETKERGRKSKRRTGKARERKRRKGKR